MDFSRLLIPLISEPLTMTIASGRFKSLKLRLHKFGIPRALEIDIKVRDAIGVHEIIPRVDT